MSESRQPASRSPETPRGADANERTATRGAAPRLLGAALAVYAIWLAYLGAVAFIASGP